MILRGKVIPGRGLGTKLGYPTANIQCADCPNQGVYAARVAICDQVTNESDLVTYNAVAVIGARDNLVEVLLFDFKGDLYGQELEVEILKKVSEIENFDNKADLIKKIENDIKLCSQE